MLKLIMVIKMLYKRIKELRKEKGITQVNVSTNIGVEESYYGKYERGVHDIPLSERGVRRLKDPLKRKSWKVALEPEI